MPPAAETVCANPAPVEFRLEPPPWDPEPFEACDTLQMRFRAVAWGVLVSSLMWTSLILAGRALWSWWR
jgi:hypothetical protein